MMLTPVSRLVLLLGTSLVLTGCSGVREQLGMERNSPDEFRVTTNAPLTVPPDFRLPQPQPGARPANAPSPTERARQALTGRATPQAAPSEGESQLIRAAGAQDASSDVRQELFQENQEVYADDRPILDRLIQGDDRPQGDVVDAEAEQARIEEAEQQGEPLTGAGVPVVRNRNSSLVEF